MSGHSADPSRPTGPHRRPAFTRALPAYLGGKRRLAPLIFAELANVVPPSQWSDSVLLDPFAGGGAISLYGKAHGFAVVSGDLAERAVIVSRALIANSSVRLRNEDVLELFRARTSDHPATALPPKILTDHQAQWFNAAVANTHQREEPYRSLLLLLIVKVLLRSLPMSSPKATDANAAATGDYDRISPRRLGSYLQGPALLHPQSLLRLAGDVNAGVFGGRGRAVRGDALELIARTQADVLYLDPPYPGTAGYGEEYAALDRLLGDTRPPQAAPVLADLLAASTHIKTLVLSYGGPRTDLDALVAAVAGQRTIQRALAIPYRHLGALATEQKNASNKEFLVLATR